MTKHTLVFLTLFVTIVQAAPPADNFARVEDPAAASRLLVRRGMLELISPDWQTRNQRFRSLQSDLRAEPATEATRESARALATFLRLREYLFYQCDSNPPATDVKLEALVEHFTNAYLAQPGQAPVGATENARCLLMTRGRIWHAQHLSDPNELLRRGRASFAAIDWPAVACSVLQQWERSPAVEEMRAIGAALARHRKEWVVADGPGRAAFCERMARSTGAVAPSRFRIRCDGPHLAVVPTPAVVGADLNGDALPPLVRERFGLARMPRFEMPLAELSISPTNIVLDGQHFHHLKFAGHEDRATYAHVVRDYVRTQMGRNVSVEDLGEQCGLDNSFFDLRSRPGDGNLESDVPRRLSVGSGDRSHLPRSETLAIHR